MNIYSENNGLNLTRVKMRIKILTLVNYKFRYYHHCYESYYFNCLLVNCIYGTKLVLKEVW